MSEKEGGYDRWIEQKKDLPPREAEETFIFRHEAAEASDAGFTRIFFLCLLLLTRGQNPETWQHITISVKPH